MDNKILELLMEMKSEINGRFDGLEQKVDNLDGEIKGIKVQLTQFQDEYTETIKEVADKTEIIKNDVSEMKESILQVEQITATNWRDISRLKSLRQ